MLDIYKVLDFTDEKGRLCAKLLANLGAKVTRLEKPGRPVEPHYTQTAGQTVYLDIETEASRKLFRRLIQDADVLIESFSPGYLGSLGQGYPDLSLINAHLIMVSITPYGQTGPYRDYKSSELVASAAGGQAYVCGEPDKPPLKPYGPQPYNTASLFAANAILLALLHRPASGRGQYIDISIHECVAATLDHVLVRYFYEGLVAQRQGSLYWNHSFRIFSCRDGYILLSWSQGWETLVELLDSEGLAADLKDRRWLDETERRRNVGHIIEVLEKWTLIHKVDELVELGQLMHFPWARVASIPDVVANPQLNDRGFFREAVDPASGLRYRYPGPPWKLEPPQDSKD